LEVGGTPTAREVSYAGLETGLSYEVEITVTNPAGSRTVTTSFDTFDAGELTFIEAENYNFDGGNYFNFDELVYCNDIGGGVEGCYFDRVSTPNVDALDVNGNTDDTQDVDNVFRFGPDFTRVEQPDTFVSDDVLRDVYAEAPPGANGPIQDYDLDLINPGDWWNYTRVFEEGTYRVFLRVAAGADAEFELGLVTSDPTQTDQTVDTIGSFVVSAGGGYKSVPLTNEQGAPQAFQLSGEQTLRLTAVSGDNVQVNHFFLSPFEASGIPTSVSLSAPEDGRRFLMGQDITLSATANGPDGTASSISQVEFFAAAGGADGVSVGTATEPPFEVVVNDLELGTHEITAVATADDESTAESSPISTEIVD
jgi:hypothetical protein